MTQLLHVDSSVLGTNSVSRQLTADVAAEWRRANPGARVDYLDLAVDAPGHFTADSMAIKTGVQTEPTDAQRRENALSEKLVSQFLAADTIVLGAPMYNFSVPSQLKAWIDRLAQAGRTFKYTEQGAVGLAGGKTVIVVSTRGGVYSTSDAAGVMDHPESYLRAVFGFFGITDVRFVRAEGLAMGDAPRAAAFANARAGIPAATLKAVRREREAIAA